MLFIYVSFREVAGRECVWEGGGEEEDVCVCVCCFTVRKCLGVFPESWLGGALQIL